jgi:endo-beta-N-acetylglucosaminidase D
MRSFKASIGLRSAHPCVPVADPFHGFYRNNQSFWIGGKGRPEGTSVFLVD